MSRSDSGLKAFRPRFCNRGLTGLTERCLEDIILNLHLSKKISKSWRCAPMQSKLPLPVFWQSSGLDLYKFLGFNEIDSLDRNENLMKHLEDLCTSEPSNPPPSHKHFLGFTPFPQWPCLSLNSLELLAALTSSKDWTAKSRHLGDVYVSFVVAGGYPH